MAKFTKPSSNDLNIIWGDNSTVDNFNRPSDDYIHNGWLQVRPPYQIENWSMNKLHAFIAYINQRGIPEWDEGTEYHINSSYIMGSDGKVYKCIQTNIGRNPTYSNNSAYWELTSLDRYATTSKAGIAQQATLDEVKAGINNTKYVTPATYKQSLPAIPTPLDSTEAQRGIIELATWTETKNGLDNVRAVTPVNLSRYKDEVIIPQAVPSGMVVNFAGTTAPQGYLECNGREYSRTEYSALFTVIGTRYGSGNGSTTFNVPDLRGEIVRGWDNGRGLDSGRQLGSLQGHSIASHSHTGSTAGAGVHSHVIRIDNGGSHNHTGDTANGGNHSHGGTATWAGQHNHTGTTSTNGWHDHGTNWPYGAEGDSSNWLVVGNSGRSEGNFTRRTEANGNHNHSFTTTTVGNHQHGLSIDWGGVHYHSFTTNYSGTHAHGASADANGNHTHSFTTDNTGGNETRPRNVALMYIIKT